MDNIFTLPIWTILLEFTDDIKLVSPLLIPESLAANKSPAIFAQELVTCLEENTIKQGEYLEMLRYTPTLSLSFAQLKLFVPSPHKRIYPDISLDFDYFYTQLPNQYYIGFVPVLGVEGYAPTTDELVGILQESIRLEFTRKNRYANVRDLITTQWYTTITADKHLIDSYFYNPSELTELQQKREHQWLPNIAKELKRHVQCRCFGRSTELKQLLRALIGKYNRNILLVGRAGVGKTALIEEVYRSEELQTVTFWETTAARMLQKLTAKSGWEESLGQVLEEISQLGDFLYVRNLAQLFEVGAYVGNAISMAEFMREHLALGSVHLISECTDEELANIEARAPGYTNLFQILRVEPPLLKQQADIVRQRLQISHPKSQISKTAIEETLALQHRYAVYSGFPGKTVHFLESILNHEQNTQKTLDSDVVVTQFSEESGMPRFLIDNRSHLKLKKLQDFFKTRLFGQEAAINIVVHLLASVKTRLSRPGKPIASLLFVGPTGVGKTELAKALAECMFGDSERLIRFDMSEFADEVSVLRLTGDASATKQGLLTNKVRQQPFSVLLFDELEKAHFSFYDLLLQVIGEGRLTDARGQVADFCSSVIIMTSNIGAGVSRQRNPGFHPKDRSNHALHQHYLQAVQQFFRPELFNRLDQIIPFKALDLSVLRPIVRRELDKLRKREGLRTRDVTLHIEDDVIDYLAHISENSHYGARQLQRTLHQYIVIPLANTLNRYSFSTSMTITVCQGEKGVIFQNFIHTQKTHADQKFLESQWTLRDFANIVTQERRVAYQIQEGASLQTVWSQWDIAECACTKEHWHNAKDMLTNKCLIESKALLEQIEQIEMECTLDLIGIQSSSKQLTTVLKKWQQAHISWQTYILNIVYPNTHSCWLCIYGSAEYLFQISNLFTDIVKHHDWEMTERTVWMSQDKYSYTQNMDTELLDHKLIGHEFELKGLGVSLYFAQESGVHIWKEQKNIEHSYAVLIGCGEIEDGRFTTPEGVHRKIFLEDFEKKRVYEKHGFVDLGDKKSYTEKNWRSLLEQQLDEKFKMQLQTVLCGELTDLDLPYLGFCETLSSFLDLEDMDPLPFDDDLSMLIG